MWGEDGNALIREVQQPRLFYPPLAHSTYVQIKKTQLERKHFNITNIITADRRRRRSTHALREPSTVALLNRCLVLENGENVHFVGKTTKHSEPWWVSYVESTIPSCSRGLRLIWMHGISGVYQLGVTGLQPATARDSEVESLFVQVRPEGLRRWGRKQLSGLSDMKSMRPTPVEGELFNQGVLPSALFSV